MSDIKNVDFNDIQTADNTFIDDFDRKKRDTDDVSEDDEIIEDMYPEEEDSDLVESKETTIEDLIEEISKIRSERKKREVDQPKSSLKSNNLIDENRTTPGDVDGMKLRTERQIQDGDFTSVRAVYQGVSVDGIRVEDSAKEPKIVDDGVPSVLADTGVTLRLVILYLYLTVLFSCSQ